MTAGESHGPRLTALVEGVPSGLALLAEDIDRDLARRQRGYGRGGRMKIERDELEFLAGVRGSETLGSPVAVIVRNRDYLTPKVRALMDPLAGAGDPLTNPRPGHADYAYDIKYGLRDYRGGGRQSAQSCPGAASGISSVRIASASATSARFAATRRRLSWSEFARRHARDTRQR